MGAEMKKVYVAMIDSTPIIAFESKRNADEYIKSKDATVEELIVIGDGEYPSDKHRDNAQKRAEICFKKPDSASEGGK